MANKTQVIEALAERLGDKKVAAEAVDGLVDIIVRTVNKGETVTITGFGAFEKRARGARTARNPRTGESVRVKKTNVPAFRAGTMFREVVGGKRKLPKAATRRATSATASRPSGTTTRAAAATKAAPAKSTATKSTATKSTAAKPAAAKSTAGRATTKAAPAKATAAKPAAAKTTAAKSAAKPAAKNAATKATAKSAPKTSTAKTAPKSAPKAKNEPKKAAAKKK